MRLNVKYLISLTQLLLLLLLLLKKKIPSVINLAKKTDNNTKINEIEKKITDHNLDKYITTPEFNKFAAETFDLRLNQANFKAKVILLISKIRQILITTKKPYIK